MSDNLRPCPFCGTPPQANTWVFYGISETRYFCPNQECPLSVRTSTLERWNRRPIEDALTARVAELEAGRRWRVVADGELPELGKEVIFYDSIMERRLKGCLRKNGGVEWLSDEGYTFSSRDGRYSRITHWMYAPQPPEVQE